MSNLILHIDTALGKASVSLANNDALIAVKENLEMRDQAGWIHTAIQTLLQDNNYTLAQLKAVAVVAGPGSYTGLRIGLATAKGFCYALQIPLIAINTLELISAAAKPHTTDLVCAMVDARRMEVFMAIYNKAGEAIVAPTAKIINENSFDNLLNQHQIVFAGNSNGKVKVVVNHPNAFFLEYNYTVSDICTLANLMYVNNSFSELAYVEPFYIKEFYNISNS